MNNKGIAILIFSLLFLGDVYAQCPSGGAIFVNEIYNKTGDPTEYIELVVVGDPANPTAPVDLTGWIVDDNNINQAGQGTATGHLKLDNTFSSINPGAIILIYNENYPYPGLPPNNPPWLYVVAGSDIDGCSTSPNTTNSSFTPCGTVGGSYPYVGMRNGGDILQTRDASENFYHALRYGTPNVEVEADVSPVDVSDKSIGLDCGDWFDGDNYTITTQTPGDFNSPQNEFLIMSIRDGSIDCSNIDLSCDPPCPEITGITIEPSSFCDYQDFTVTATGLANMGQDANGETDFGIEFVYFPGATPPTDAYSGGTSLKIVPYESLTGIDPNQQAEIFVDSGVMSPGIYNICAILNPESTDPDCDPQQCEVVEIFESPTASLSGTQIFCPGDCHVINTVIQGGTTPYHGYFILDIGVFNIPFDIDHYGVDNQLTICYSGTAAPHWDDATNTFYVPTSMFGIPFTGTGSITMTNLVDANDCEAQTINPDNMTLIFKEELSIVSDLFIEQCESYEYDDKATFDLTTLDTDLSDGQSDVTTNWYENSDCTIPINSPDSYTTITTTVYVFLTDDTGDKCNSDTVPVDLIVLNVPNPGENNDLLICNTEYCINLLYELDGNPESGGEWTDNAGNIVTNADCFDFTGMGEGTYVFTYTTEDDSGICVRDAVLTVDVSIPGDAGIGDDIIFCGAPTDLIDLNDYLSGADNDGTWYDNDNNIVLDPNNVDMSTYPIDTYVYTYVIENHPCELQDAIVTIEIIDIPNAGNDDTLHTCISGSNTILNLNNALGGHTAGGYWTDNDTSGVGLNDPSYVDFSVVTEVDTFTFTYLIPEDGDCSEDSAMITVIVEEAPFAGTDGNQSICIGNTDTINLFSYLGTGIDSTGKWTQIGGDSINIARPDTMIFISEPVGIDSFMYITSGTCGADTALVFIEITASPYAGDNYSYTICQNEIVNLYDSLLNSTIGGTWVNSNNDTIFTPDNILLDEIKTYNFSYILDENGTCAGDTAYANITTVSAPNAGTGIDFSVCQNSANTINLFDQLTGYSQNDGTWYDYSGNIISSPNSYSFGSYPNGDFTIKYILDDNGYCPADTAELTVYIVLEPNAGNDNSIEICNSEINNTINFDLLIGSHDNTGKWIDIANTGVNIHDSTKVSFIGISAGSYEYKYVIAENQTCPADSATIIVTVLDKIKAGNNKELSFCEGATDIINIINELSPDTYPNYIFEDIDNSGALTSSNVDLSKLSLGTFRYNLITGENHLCGTDTSVLTINIVEAYKAGTNNNIEICNDEDDIDLDILLGTHNSGGIWSDLDNSGIDINNSDATHISFSGLSMGVYRFQYKFDASGTCPESIATITVTVNPVTYYNFTQAVCPRQNISIGNGIYNLNNPTGTEILVNALGCDSIVTINLSSKEIGSQVYSEQENCFGQGKFIIENLDNATLPATINIQNIGEYTINSLPFTIGDLPANDYIFSIVDDEGCEILIDATFTIDEFTPFTIDLTAVKNDDSYRLNIETDITPETIIWTPENGLSCNDCLNPIAKPDKDQQYIVEITDIEGCTVSDTITLEAIITIEIDIPNVFSPDGDGGNDTFYPKSNNTELKYTMYIFDRWGEKIFYAENLNFNDANAGWDGRYKGEHLNTGVFVYMIVIDYGNDKTETRAGDVLLLR